MSRVLADVQHLFSSLNERMIDFKECVNQLIFQEIAVASATGSSNVNYSQFYSKFLESLSVWRPLIRTVI
jgi:hypothetical protein